jgi:hypothetical protein
VPEDPLLRAARLARRMPGYHWVRRRAVPRIRRSGAARTLAYRLFAAGSRGSVEAPLELAGGRLLTGLGTERLPVILVSLVGLTNGIGTSASSGQVVEAVIDEVAEMQLLGAGFRPVFLLDVPAFRQARSYGYLVELVTPRTAWSGESADWSDYVAARVASMTRTYGVSAMITAGPDGLNDAARGVLRSFDAPEWNWDAPEWNWSVEPEAVGCDRCGRHQSNPASVRLIDHRR